MAQREREYVIGFTKSSDSEKISVGNVKKFLDKETNCDINYQDNNNDNISSVAGNQEASKNVEFPMKNGTQDKDKYNNGKDSLDNVNHFKDQNGIQTLDVHTKKFSSPLEKLTEQEIEVNRKLTVFVEKFVCNYEDSLEEYKDRLENQIGKSGKWADFAKKILDVGKYGSEGISLETSKVSSLVGINLIQKIISCVGINHNRNELKKIIHQLYLLQEDPVCVRKELIKCGVQIFQCFESQFVQVAADGSWKRAMDKLAHDAVGRIFNYCKENVKAQFSLSLLAKGLLYGKSKKYKHLSTGLPRTTPGHTLTANTNSWNTADLFDKPGIVIKKNDESASKYYAKMILRDDDSEYGYRLLFNWESNDTAWLEKLIELEYQEVHLIRKEYQYILKRDKNSNDVLESEILEKINIQDTKLLEHRLVKYFQEGIKEINQQSKKSFINLEKYINDNFCNISTYIENHKNEIMEIFNKITQKTIENEEFNLRYCQEVTKQCQKLDFMCQDISNISTKVHDIHTVIVEKETKRTRIKPIWFEVGEMHLSFIGREEELNQIAIYIQQAIVIISGLPGVGKSELAIKYARSNYDKNDSVVWINGDTVKNSFYKLYKKLEFKIIDEDGQKKIFKFIVEDIYEHFCDRKCLFIFDNIENFKSIEQVLPLNLPNNSKRPDVIIISCNSSEWESDTTHIKVLPPLSDFKKLEAIQFVKDVLNIQDETKDEAVTELVEKVHYFPLALQYATKYIKNVSKEYEKRNLEFGVTDYNKLLSSEQGTYEYMFSKTWKVTLKKIREGENGEHALRMLNIMSYLAPHGIPEQMFLKKLADGNQAKLICITRSIEKYSIVRLNGMLSVHGLVQKVRRSELKGENDEETTLEESLILLTDYMKDCENIDVLIPHIVSVLVYARNFDIIVDKFLTKNVDEIETIPKFLNLVVKCCTYETVKIVINKIERNSNKLGKIFQVRDGDRRMTIHYAALNVDERVIGLLIEKGAKVNAKMKHDWVPLHIATKNGYLNVVNILLNKNANICQKTGFKFTSLHLAARNGFSDIVRALLHKNADINANDKHKYTPLHFAAKRNRLEIVKILLEDRRTNVNAETEYKYTPLHLVVKKGYRKIVEVLLKNGASVNAKNFDNLTALHFAALYNHEAITNDLLKETQINVNSQTTKGNTPMHLAAEFGNLKIVQSLIAMNADVSLKNMEEKVAVDLALEKGHLEVATFITENTYI